MVEIEQNTSDEIEGGRDKSVKDWTKQMYCNEGGSLIKVGGGTFMNCMDLL